MSRSNSDHLHLEHRPQDGSEAYALALLDRERLILVDRRELVAARVLPHPLFYAAGHLLGLILAAVAREPARALQDITADQEHGEAQERPDPKRDPPAVTATRLPSAAPPQKLSLMASATWPLSRAGITGSRDHQPVPTAER